MNEKELYNLFVELVEKGDEDAARQFLIDHMNDFSEEVRKNIAYAFFVDAINKEAAISELQKAGLEMMKESDVAEAVLADASKAADLREAIS